MDRPTEKYPLAGLETAYVRFLQRCPEPLDFVHAANLQVI
jgi:hypothetical protein